ncbi:unnamed protein product [Gongylonema pulchrum]|uniref:TDP43_N domain-containing protein n=1 Tax=Gongylonema pulchrum TaxID=637853 RepID=A0A183EUF2_9BILA|nr:unnamed protein product [Gongylonema pulchrum]
MGDEFESGNGDYMEKRSDDGQKEEENVVEQVEEEYVCVCATEEEDCTPLELPLTSDGSLSCSTLSHSFPKAIGLKYKNETTGLFRTLL